MRMPSRIHLLPKKKFWAAYLPLCHAIKNPSPELKKRVFAELTLLDSVLEPALKARWGKTDAYYEISADWNVCWHHSMGVYSDQMCCGEFLDIVQTALSRMEHDWCFHVSLECEEDMGWGEQKAGFGQIFFFRGKVYGDRTRKFKYALFDD